MFSECDIFFILKRYVNKISTKIYQFALIKSLNTY